MNDTTTLVRWLIQTNRRMPTAEIADQVGVSRERVRQIIRQHDLPWEGHGTQLSWDCPGCKTRIEVTIAKWEEKWGFMPAHCRECVRLYLRYFCYKGHPKAKDQSRKQSLCLACQRIRSHRVVEIRTCEICKRPLEITEGKMRQILLGNALGRYHKDCYYNGVLPRIAASRGHSDYCKRGHEFTKENTYIPPKEPNHRACRACQRLREERRQRKEVMRYLHSNLHRLGEHQAAKAGFA